MSGGSTSFGEIPGTRLVEVRDDEATSRVRLARISQDAPEPETVADPREQVERVQALVRRLMSGTPDDDQRPRSTSPSPKDVS